MQFKKALSKTLKFLLCLGTGILLLWFAFREVNYRELIEKLKNARYSWLLLSLAFGIIAYISRSMRWNLLINPLGYKPSLSNTFHALLFGYLANTALPRVGEITRCIALGRKESIPVDKLIGTVVIERTIDLLTTAIFTIILIIWASDGIRKFLNVSIFIPLKEQIFSLISNTWIIWTALIVICAVIIFLTVKYRKKLAQTKFFSMFFSIMHGLFDGLKTIVSMDKKFLFVLHTLIIWTCYTLMTWIALFSLNGVVPLGLGNALFLLVLGSIGMAIPVQGGFGSFHYFISRGLAFIKGVSLEEGLTYAILSHESQLLLIIILGIISTFVIFGKKRKQMSGSHEINKEVDNG